MRPAISRVSTGRATPPTDRCRKNDAQASFLQALKLLAHTFGVRKMPCLLLKLHRTTAKNGVNCNVHRTLNASCAEVTV